MAEEEDKGTSVELNSEVEELATEDAQNAEEPETEEDMFLGEDDQPVGETSDSEDFLSCISPLNLSYI